MYREKLIKLLISNALKKSGKDLASSCSGVVFLMIKKGLCHIWQAETSQEKINAQKEIDAWNRTHHD